MEETKQGDEASHESLFTAVQTKITNWWGLQEGTEQSPNHLHAWVACIVLAGFLVGYVLYTHRDGDWVGEERHYSQAYSFVPEKLSKSADIAILLPEGITPDIAKANIFFDPQVKGTWASSSDQTIVVFQPDEPLEVGKYYAVALETETMQVKGDFLVDEDPKVISVFPSSESEAHEQSEITFIFNRPMVPLTTLEVNENNLPPVHLNPPTTGRFKWISTRNLQFIPDERLVRSSNYTVTFGDGFKSVEGLPVQGMNHSFITRPLRYTSQYPNGGGMLSYRRPITLNFNQPVDRDATAELLRVRDVTTDTDVPVYVEYSIREVYDEKTKQSKKFIDRTALRITPREDQHGRKRLWDFEHRYQISLRGAIPMEGDIMLQEPKEFTVTISNVISSFTASSDRSEHVRTELFDPQGSATFTFAEDMDLGRSNIQVKGLKNIAYGKKCDKDDDGNTIYTEDRVCKKVDDVRKFVLTFNPAAFTQGEHVLVNVKRLVNTEGLSVLPKAKQFTLKVYPHLSILRTYPSEGSIQASVADLIICTNTPLMPRTDEDYGESLRADKRLVFGSWGTSRRITNNRDKCAEGTFKTTIRYGLLPETPYQLTLNLVDEFTQQAGTQFSFTTAKPDTYYRFHSLQPQYNVTLPGRTKLTFAAENLTYMNVRICKMTAENFLRVTNNRPEWHAAQEGYPCAAVKTDRIELPKKFWVNNYFQVNVGDYFPDVLGHYVVTFSHPDYTGKLWNSTARGYRVVPKYERSYISVTNLAVGEKRVEWNPDTGWRKQKNEERVLRQNNNLYWISNARTLTPVVGARVDLYTGSGGWKKVSTYTSDERGVATGEVVPDISGAVVSAGNDTAIVSEWSDRLQYASDAYEMGKTYLYSDRPIYRPTQEVFLKGIHRIGYDGNYDVVEGHTGTLVVTDSRSEELLRKEITLNKFGTFEATVSLPEDVSLGRYRAEAFGGRYHFDVEEYVPSAFDLTVAPQDEEYIAGDTMKVDIDANYFFGVPVEGGEVTYSVTAQNYYFDRYTDEYFRFGNPWYYCYSCSYGDEFLFRGSTQLDEKGHATIERALDFEKLFTKDSRDNSKLFVVHATVKDQSGRSVYAESSFIVHRGEVYLGVKTDPRYTGKLADVTVRAKSVDTQGKPKGIRGIDMLVEKVEWKSFKRREVDGGYYWHSEEERTQIMKKRISTDGNGDGSEVIQFPEEGRYKVTLKTSDIRGNEVSSDTTIYVYGEGQVSVRPTNNHDLEIETEKLDVSVGENAQIVVQSPFKKAKALITVERGKVFEYWIKDVTSNLFAHTIPIKEGYSPNVFASVLLLSDDPEIKYGQVEFNVDRAQRELHVEVKANKETYLPGEQVTLDVVTTNYKGDRMPAEVSIAVADLSVLALKGNPKKNPLVFFYNGFPLTVTTASNMKNILHEVDIPLGTKGGGGDALDLAKKKRGVFKDTAFWEADIVTDERGMAQVTFTLPDNLTSWQIESLGITGDDTLVGIDYQEFKARKNVMAIPIKPRFIIPGDEFSVGATVFNQTNETQTFTVSVTSETLEFTNDTEKKVVLKPEEKEIVYFDTRAPSSITGGTHVFEISAVAPQYEDVVVQTIPVTPNDTYESVATAHFTKDPISTEYIYVPDEVLPDKGGLTINANATLATFMTGALQYLVSYPYGCSEQLASKLSALAIVKRGQDVQYMGETVDFDRITFNGQTYTSDQVVLRALAQIYQNQNEDGGFGYYINMDSRVTLTLHLIAMFHHLEEAGYEIDRSVVNRAVAYVISHAGNGRNNTRNTIISTVYTLREAGVERSRLSPLVNRIRKEMLTDELFMQEEISSLTLGQLAIIVAGDDFSFWERKAVLDQLESRIDIDGRGAFMKTMNTEFQFRDYFETPVKNTAMMLKALVAHENEHPLQDKILRWLLASRSKDGAWGSTNNTLTVIDAMTDFLEWQRETESDFNLTINLDGKELLNSHFSTETILEERTLELSINRFARNKLQTLLFTKRNNNDLNNNLYYDMFLKYYLPADQLPPRDEGITIERELYALSDIDKEQPLRTASVGDVVRGHIRITVPRSSQAVSIEDIIPAGFEIVNFDLATEDKSIIEDGAVGQGEVTTYALEPKEPEVESSSLDRAWIQISSLWEGSIEESGSAQTGSALEEYLGYLDEYKRPHRTLPIDFKELHDDRVFLFTERLNKGVYEYDYYVRALIPGEYQHLPAVASEMYFPEVFGRTAGNIFTIVGE